MHFLYFDPPKTAKARTNKHSYIFKHGFLAYPLLKAALLASRALTLAASHTAPCLSSMWYLWYSGSSAEELIGTQRNGHPTLIPTLIELMDRMWGHKYTSSTVIHIHHTQHSRKARNRWEKKTKTTLNGFTDIPKIWNRCLIQHLSAYKENTSTGSVPLVLQRRKLSTRMHIFTGSSKRWMWFQSQGKMEYKSMCGECHIHPFIDAVLGVSHGNKISCTSLPSLSTKSFTRTCTVLTRASSGPDPEEPANPQLVLGRVDRQVRLFECVSQSNLPCFRHSTIQADAATVLMWGHRCMATHPEDKGILLAHWAV